VMRRSGLRKISKSIKGGRRRSYWVKASPKTYNANNPKPVVRALQAVVGKPSQYKSNPTRTTAKTNFKIGAFSTLMGLHRADKTVVLPTQLALHTFGNYTTHVMRSHFHGRESPDQYTRNAIVGHGSMAAGQVVGAFAHEALRQIHKRVRS